MTLAAEFPNDNPDLHDGTIWVCLELTGAPVAERRSPLLVVIEPVVQPVVQPIAELVAEPVVQPVVEAVAADLVHPVIATLAEPILPSTVEPPVARESGIFMTFSSLREEEELDEEGEILVEELGPLEDAILEAAVQLPLEPAIEQVREPEPVLEAFAEPEPVSTIAPPAPDDSYVTFVSTLVEIAIAHGATAAAGELPAALDADKVAQAWAGIIRGTSEDWDAVGGSMLDEWAADTLARVTGADAQILKRELRARGIAAFGLAA